LQTQKRLNEDAIDFDLLEDLICYIDESCPTGAVLVFLPVSLRHNVSLMLFFQIHRFLVSYHMDIRLSLVVLQGVAEIEMLIDRLSASVRFKGASSDWILPLHSMLSPTDQRKVFQSPPENIRKVRTLSL
jgi:ATP-dependent RNA helicase DHX29